MDNGLAIYSSMLPEGHVNVENIQNKHGSGICIRYADRMYEQTISRFSDISSLFRFYRADDKYKGVILFPRVSDADFPFFKGLTDQLAELTGDKVMNSRRDFYQYMHNKGLEIVLSGGVELRLNRTDGDFYNPWSDYNQHHRPLAHKEIGRSAGITATAIAGVADIGIFAGGIALVGLTIAGASVLAGPIIVSTAVGFTLLLVANVEGRIYELGAGAGLYPEYMKLKEPTHIIGEVQNAIRGLERQSNLYDEDYARNLSASTYALEIKSLTKAEQRLKTSLQLLHEVFEWTPNMKGISVSFSDPDEEKVLAFFRKLLPQDYQTEDFEWKLYGDLDERTKRLGRKHGNIGETHLLR